MRGLVENNAHKNEANSHTLYKSSDEPHVAKRVAAALKQMSCWHHKWLLFTPYVSTLKRINCKQIHEWQIASP